jgi:hypothetical protein
MNVISSEMEDAADIPCSKALKTANAVCGAHINSVFKCTCKASYRAELVMLPISMSCALLKTWAKLTPHVLNKDN